MQWSLFLCRCVPSGLHKAAGVRGEKAGTLCKLQQGFNSISMSVQGFNTRTSMKHKLVQGRQRHMISLLPISNSKGPAEALLNIAHVVPANHQDRKTQKYVPDCS
jgi:hypothetical protein